MPESHSFESWYPQRKARHPHPTPPTPHHPRHNLHSHPHSTHTTSPPLLYQTQGIFPCMSYFSLLLVYGWSSNTFMHNKWPNENPNGNKYKQYFILFKNFADAGLKNGPFSGFCEFAPPIKKNTPFFVKMSTSFVNALVGSGGPRRQLAHNISVVEFGLLIRGFRLQ